LIISEKLYKLENNIEYLEIKYNFLIKRGGGTGPVNPQQPTSAEKKSHDHEVKVLNPDRHFAWKIRRGVL